VFPAVFDALELYAKGGEHKDRTYSRQFSIAGSNPFRPARQSLSLPGIDHDKVGPSDVMPLKSIMKRGDLGGGGSRRASTNGEALNGIDVDDTV